MTISKSVKMAGILVAVVVAYFLVRAIFSGGETAVESTAESKFAVVYQTIAPGEWRTEVSVRGRTQADRKVIVRAETAGAVAETPTELGARVSQGDVLCRLSLDARAAKVAEAEAALAKARLDYQAALELQEEGFRAATAVASDKASLDLATANLQSARIEMSKIEIIAPFDGVFDNRAVEKGDFLRVGDPCGTVIQQSPYLVVGAVSERDVAKIAKGDRGVARLATGETVEGVVRFVATAADPATRTFDVELEVPNEEGRLRDGVTAQFSVFGGARDAHPVPRSALTQNDDGEIGVRVVADDGHVQFAAVEPVGENEAGFWVLGLDGAVQLIVRGQHYVRVGQPVEAIDAATLDDGAQS
ncbi:MAG: efflux RND transporter periplasmic adaptor subunit [Pseudomonadota bacterium]